MKNEVRKLREQTNLTQAAFAEKFQISVRTLQKWEQGVTHIPPYVLYMMCKILEYEGRIGIDE